MQAAGDADAKKIPCAVKPGAGLEEVGTPGRGRNPCPRSLNELPDFRLNEQAAGTVTKPPYCKDWPKFKILWTNVASSGINANAPCIGFL